MNPTRPDTRWLRPGRGGELTMRTRACVDSGGGGRLASARNQMEPGTSLPVSLDRAGNVGVPFAVRPQGDERGAGLLLDATSGAEDAPAP